MSLNPFSKSTPDGVPSDETIEKSLFKDTTEVREIPKMIESWLTQAYMAGEKAAVEQETKTDYTKLIGAAAIGFTIGYMVVKSGILPA